MSLRWEPLGDLTYAMSGDIVVGYIGTRDPKNFFWRLDGVALSKKTKKQGYEPSERRAASQISRRWQKWLRDAALEPRGE